MKWLLYLWTFPCPLMALVNRREPATDLEDVWVYRWWLGGRRFAFAAWPFIYVAEAGDARRVELMHHEDRHLQQQLWVGGLLFLLSYGVCFIVLWPVKGFDWYAAYRAIPWEVDARRYAARQVQV